ncbi:Translation elongation factor P [invertebrate metagenome]|uniref:Translation elongation factor P n=1 Tax=invertebrate metagenome TaxID=1711999 RepID=A0A484H698_9ZZZZ
MKIQANQIRPGMMIEHEGRQWTVLKIQLIQPGKGGAFNQVEMRDFRSGTKTNVRWRTQDTVEKLLVEEKDCQYLFTDSGRSTFMETESYEQFAIPRDTLGERAAFLREGMAVTVDFLEGNPVSVNLPLTVIMTVIEADAAVRGQTATASYKPGILENGLKVMIPPFIEAGTRIVVSTADGSYVERAKD